MSEIIKRRMSESVGKEVKIFTNNNFRYAGKLINFDDEFIEILDRVVGGYKIIKINDIKDLEVRE